MVHIIIGTKAQFIKMAPLMKGLESRGIPYNFINLGQHGATVKRLAEQFGVGAYGYTPIQDSKFKIQEDVVSLFGMLKWSAGLLFALLFRKRYIKGNVFKGQGGVALIHGDTLSTLIGLLMAKRAGLKVAHVESGLRSWNYLHPFPEELIRVICMRYSDYLFAPSDEAVENLKKMGVKGKVFNTHGNTGMDAVRMALETEDLRLKTEDLSLISKVLSLKPYVLVSIHRFENLYSKKRFKFILDTVDEVSKRFNVIFAMHGPTERKLEGLKTQDSRLKTQDLNLTSKVLSPKITYLPLQDYPTFLQLIKNAEFVITDGGSVQEECSYLGKPCLVMRKKTERNDGIGENAALGRFDRDVIGEFISYYKRYGRPESSPKIRPTEVLIDELLMLNNSVSSVA